MNFSLSKGFTASLLLVLSSPSTTAAIEYILTPDESISDKIQNVGQAMPGPNTGLAFDFMPRFSLYAKRADSDKTDYMARVREAVPAVTSKTTISIQDSESSYVNEDNVATILVSDDEDGVLAFIAVEKKGGNVNGIVHKGNGEKMKFTQRGGGGKAMATIAETFEPPAWSCGTTPDTDPDIDHRYLIKDDHDDNRGHFRHDYSDHDHDHDHDFKPSNTQDAMADLKHSLRGSELHLGKRRRVQGGSYSYWVDVYIEIDYEFCNYNGETEIGPNTINYINALFAGANIIYESEINTHLSVLHINLNSNYDIATNTEEAYAIMRNIYGGSSWHYTSPSGINPDLHHALLGRDLGGGRAGIGSICDSTSGFGVSGGVTGSFGSLDNSAVWDMVVFVHEIGHNFGSGHTHDGYSPQIDTCGSGQCSSQLPLAKSATIMSYCHRCNGGMENVDYTFGGKYSGSGDRSDINSYYNSPLQGSVSFEPRQVNAKMNAHVSSRGTCTLPPSSALSTFTITVQAENYSNNHGVTNEGTTDEGGGENVASIDPVDWMSYPEVTLPSAGLYTVEYRVSSESQGGSFQFERAGGTPVYGSVSFPATGDWQSWITVSHTVNLDAGPNFFGILATGGAWNLNWFHITEAITVQAENYSNNHGVTNEGTTDEGGGENVASIDPGDWMSYPEVTLPSAGLYTVEYRVSSESQGGSFQFERAGGTPVYGSVSFPATGDWQSWVTVSHTVNLEAGPNFFGILATGGAWNLNWFRIIKDQCISANCDWGWVEPV